MARTKCSLVLLVCLLVGGLMLPKAALTQGGVTYVYDELGRLVGVIDPTGNAAVYTYDGTGNILSIARYSTSQVSIIQFTPKSGPFGASVTIYGTGFNTTPAQNTVKFNGTVASVTSATVNQIIATVPASATTGPINVTTPNGTATSSTPFSVTSPGGTPTITSFTPTIATAGTAVNITGTNFDPSAANDRLRFNTTEQPVSSATATTLAATVPAATASGRLTLLTTSGTAQSGQDLFIPFGSHVAGDVGFTGRTSTGGAQTIALSSKKKIGLLVLDAFEGQRVSVQMSGSTFRSCTLYLFSPTATQLASSGCTSATASFGPVPLPVTGTYTLGVDPSGGTGSVTLTLTLN